LNEGAGKMKITPVPMSVIRDFGDMFYSPHILIIIKTPGQEDYKPMDNKNRLAVMTLIFHDADVADGGIHNAFNESHAERILGFVEKWKDKIGEIVINCTAGFSRSPGVAAALSKIINGDDEEYFRKYSPNMLVYITILKTYQKEKEDV